ncbi:MAG TPA: alpha/beta hydrolase [Lacipirellulaceae bacterium]|jgi:pimeloyl-ACP methyl ester carboxylesterase|nr:alpha/beta hydrolase [Lacipirellulaceae bacterium]
MKTIALTNGGLAYVDEGNGQPVLLIHGFPLDHTMWAAQIASLAEHARVFAPDLRGFGQSPLGAVDPQHGISMAQYAEELAEFLSALEIAEPICIAGFSMGGYVAWQFVQRFKQRVRALIQCDTRALADTAEGRAGRIKMAENVAEWGSRRVAEMMGPKLFSARALETQPQLMAEVRRVVEETPAAAIAAAQRGMAARPDVTAMLPTIDMPTLVLVGEVDAISPPAEMQAIADAIPNSEFVVIPASGHMTTMESPRAVNDAILDYLERI